MFVPLAQIDLRLERDAAARLSSRGLAELFIPRAQGVTRTLQRANAGKAAGRP